MKRFLLNLVLVVVLVPVCLGSILLVSCLGGILISSNDDPIKGVVGTEIREREIDGSYLQPGDYLLDDCKPLRGARVYLTFDKEGRDAIEGFEAESDVDGRYTIPVKGIPPPVSPDGYFLVVQKEGYEPLIHAIKVGPLSRYLSNAAILKPSQKK